MVASRDEENGMTSLRAIGFTVLLALAMAAAASAVPAFAPPVVVVYPLTLSGAVVHTEVGSDVAILLGARLAQDGAITLRPYTPGTTRAQFLDAALKEKADYYVTGYLQQIGSDVSMILQIVSTHSGSVVFSSTTTIKTFGDAAAQADSLHEAILRHAGRGLAALDAPAPASVPTAEPTANQGVNLTRALRHRTKATPSPSPSPRSDAELVPVSQIQAAVASASPSPVGSPAALPAVAPAITPIPARIVAVADAKGVFPPGTVTSILVVDTGGTESDALRLEATTALVAALRASGFPAARLPIAAAQASTNAASLCRANPGAQRLYVPSLSLGRDPRGASLATIRVASVDCNGTIAATHDATSIGTALGGDASAIERAAAAVTALLTGT
jgi:hypothetical protein